MSGNTRGAVAFDFDGTLTTRDTTRFLILALLRNRPGRIFEWIPLVVRFLLRKIPVQEFKDLSIGCLIKGLRQDQFGGALEHYATSVKGLLREELVAIAKQHEDAGDLVIVATASPAFAVAYVLSARRIEVIGAEF